ncbi:MAG TPA: Hsp20/alpha crystallin family protein [Bacteroidia bacterium]|nr:Hsp20/alpha crystallin family protein [Bacteroidia bacterium]MBP7715034.1 Hsp20/alpha crystallin family protein [Bacteroidia bacterium]MBP8669104.1 Hsp20/alpha crystallin family protein [Bacteroidia bacterium]HOZ82524.1 Hsp20/alpha crystallin family protein [Bacteroidia bacterium]HQW18460.1 Hsp20/alpha crystallin family protein [Bacteroidia bacterium]
MTLIKFKNEPASRMMDRSPMFSDLFNDFFDGVVSNNITKSFSPSVNVKESDHEFKLELAAPGLSKDDFKINIENDMLNISAEKKEEQATQNEKYTHKEFSYSSFKRTFTLPETADREKISAAYDNGVMTLVIPKKDEARPKPLREIKIS